MKSYKSKKAYTSKKSLYLAIVFVIVSTLVIVAVSFKRSFNSSRSDSIVKVEPPKLAIPTTDMKYDVKKDVKKSDDLAKQQKKEYLDSSVKVEESSGSKLKQKMDEAAKKEPKKEETKEETKKEEPKKKSNEGKKRVGNKFVKPLEGNIVQEFSGNKLVLSKTLGEFRTHNGIDIEALPQTPVKAICDGVVINLFNDTGRWGTCVEIEHENGLVSIYRGLSDVLNVKLESKVKAGEIIGVVGDDKTNAFESALGSHLHLEVKKGEDFVDPLKFVKF